VQPVPFDQLPRQYLLDVDEYINDHPDSFAAFLKPRLGIDGSHWWVQYGGDLVMGVGGFGKSIADAMKDFDKNCSLADGDRLNPILNGEHLFARRRSPDA
jgi:hypothetical protein